jgi:hypothetical protein
MMFLESVPRSKKLTVLIITGENMPEKVGIALNCFKVFDDGRNSNHGKYSRIIGMLESQIR